MAESEMKQGKVAHKGWWIVFLAIIATLLILGELWNNVSDEIERSHSEATAVSEPTPTPLTETPADEGQAYEWDEQ
jgi:hypothetical protein